MKFGVFDHMDFSGVGLHEHLENRLKIADLYDRLRFHGYHVAEHHGTPLGFAPSPNVYLAALAQRTSRLKFGPMVYLLPLYHPLRLAEEICMLDHLSRGRFMLGTVRGISPLELGFFGVEAEDSQAIYAESYECLMRAFKDKSLSFAGDYFDFVDVPITARPYTQPHPELWYGILNPETTVWAAENNVNVVTIALAEGTKVIVERYKEEWQKLGKAEADLPLIGVSRHIVVAETDNEARDLARRAYKCWLASFSKLWHDNNLPVPLVGSIYPEEWDDLQAIGNGFAGSPESVKEYVAEQVALSGFNYFTAWFAFGDLTLSEVSRSVELFDEQVISELGS